MKQLLILAVLPGIAVADGFWPKWGKLWGKKDRYYVSKNSIEKKDGSSGEEEKEKDNPGPRAESDHSVNTEVPKRLKGRYYVSKNSMGKRGKKIKGKDEDEDSAGVALTPNGVGSKRKPHGYSYMMLGFENLSYQESFGEGPIQFSSKSTLLSPVLYSGSLFKINNRFDFSIDAFTTFTPDEDKENWRDNNGALVQTNQIEHLKAATHLLLHYKWKGHYRLVAGPSLSYQTFTRFGLRTDQSLFGDASTWEQKSTDIYMDAGLAYNTGSLFNNSRWLLNGRAILGAPFWSRTKNTAYENKSFKEGGYRAYLEGSISYEVFSGLHLGWYTQLGYEKRQESDAKTINASPTEERNVTIPEGDITYFTSGIQVFWNF